ncbi:hypothetical protein LWC35_10205 [Pseudonocardia kujensis]|nr:hypothetical protein [Pseudonocardia kujensis]
MVELPSPYEGIVAELLVQEGQTVPVGTSIIAIGSGAETRSSRPTSPDDSPAEDPRTPTSAIESGDATGSTKDMEETERI